MKFSKSQVSMRVSQTLSVFALIVFGASFAPSYAESLEGSYANKSETHIGSDKHAIVPIVFRDGTTHMRVLDSIDGVAIAEGDIIFGNASNYFNQDSNKRTVRGLSNYVYGAVWPNGIVPYRISGSLSDAAEEKVRSAIARWNDTGAINLVERTPDTESAYPHYVDFVEAGQCASWVGFQNNGAQSIYTGDKCSEGSMIHEIGHALGLLHEHTRPDRDSFVQINWNNITPEKTHNFDILEDAIVLGEYDYDSIMHYGSHFFSSNGTATITPLQGGVTKIGQREYISDGDRNSMIELYQSEYSLVSSSSTSALVGSTIQLDMFVTNNSSMGANTVRLETDVPEGTSLVSFSSPSWVCQQSGAGANVICLSPALSESSSSNVSVSLSAPAVQGEVSFDTTLTANTFDTDQSNNRDSTKTLVVMTADDLVEQEKAASEPAPLFAAATPAAAEASASSGGGSFAALGFLLLLARRRLR